MTDPAPKAPIALFVYNRPDLTQRTLEALAANTGAQDTELIVFSDGPRNEQDIAAVTDVRSVVNAASGFRSVRLVAANSNRGLAASIISGVAQVVEEHGSVIVMEDDIVTSPVFLDFMNDGLNTYRDEPRVGAISGYLFPLGNDMPETFFVRDESCWGWATWKRAWAKFEPDGGKLLAELNRKRLVRAFDVDASFPYTQMLQDQVAGRNNSWAIRWRASMFLNDMLSLYPASSLVRNIGNDGRGTHARPSDTMYDTTPRSNRVRVTPIAVDANPVAARAFKKFFRTHFAYGLVARAKRKLKRISSRALS
jgi:hypothetical protein